MQHSGDAAEQVLRMTLEGTEVALKITGKAAKEIALFLIAAMKAKSKNLKLKGKARMTSMLKSGKALEIFSIKESNLQQFMKNAKRYGIVYCVLRNTKKSEDGLCDIMVKADDAPKINRLVERLKFSKVDGAKIESDIVQSREEKAKTASADKGSEAPDVDTTNKLVDDLMTKKEGKAEKEQDKPKDKNTLANPEAGKNDFFQRAEERNRQSNSFSKNRNSTEKAISDKKSSAIGDLREIKAEMQRKEKSAVRRDERQKPGTSRTNTAPTHKQPQRTKKPKGREK